jgi:hypothetical protein
MCRHMPAPAAFCPTRHLCTNSVDPAFTYLSVLTTEIHLSISFD